MVCATKLHRTSRLPRSRTLVGRLSRWASRRRRLILGCALRLNLLCHKTSVFRDFLPPTPETCLQTYPAADRYPRNSPAETVLRPAVRNPPARASGGCFPVRPCHLRADGVPGHLPVKSATPQSYGSTSCSRRNQAKPKTPSTPRLC